MSIDVVYQEGSGFEKLVAHPLKPGHLVWRAF